MANAWISFLKEYRKKNPTLSLKAAMKSGSAEYKKSKKAGPAKKAPKRKGKGKKKSKK